MSWGRGELFYCVRPTIFQIKSVLITWSTFPPANQHFLLRFFFSPTLSQTRSSWPLPNILSCQPLFPPRLQWSPHCLLWSWFSQQKKTGSASSHVTGVPFRVKRDQRQPGELRRNHRVPRVRLTGRHSRQRVSIHLKVRCRCGVIQFNLKICNIGNKIGHWFITFCFSLLYRCLLSFFSISISV